MEPAGAMMMTLPLDARDDDILAVVRAWAELLAEERYADALAFVDHREHWEPALLRTVIMSYGSPAPCEGHDHRVTPLALAGGELKPRHEVDRCDSNAGDRVGYVWFDLPLDGEWSDLTATFDIECREGRLVLVLDDVHVM